MGREIVCCRPTLLSAAVYATPSSRFGVQVRAWTAEHGPTLEDHAG